MTWQLVLFSPSFGLGSMMLALLLPLLVHVIVGNLLEPVVFGRAMEVRPSPAPPSLPPRAAPSHRPVRSL